jgi:hypothetical protein
MIDSEASAMTDTSNVKAHHRSWKSPRGDVNGLVLVLGVLIALILLHRPTGAEYKVSDIQMNDIVVVKNWK